MASVQALALAALTLLALAVAENATSNSTANATLPLPTPTPAPLFTVDVEAELAATGRLINEARDLIREVNDTVSHLDEGIVRAPASALVEEAGLRLATARRHLVASSDHRGSSEALFMGFQQLSRANAVEARSLAQEANGTALELRRQFRDRARLHDEAENGLRSTWLLLQTVIAKANVTAGHIQEARALGLDMAAADADQSRARELLQASSSLLAEANSSSLGGDFAAAIASIHDAETKLLDARLYTDVAEDIALGSMGRSKEFAASLRAQIESAVTLSAANAKRLEATERYVKYLSSAGVKAEKYSDPLASARTHRERAAEALTSALNRLEAGLTNEAQEFTLTALDNAQQMRRLTTLASDEVRADLSALLSSSCLSSTLLLNRTLELMKGRPDVQLNDSTAVELDKGVLEVRSLLRVAGDFRSQLESSSELPSMDRLDEAQSACASAGEVASSLRQRLQAVRDAHDASQSHIGAAGANLKAIPSLMAGRDAVGRRYEADRAALAAEFASLRDRFNASDYRALTGPAKEIASRAASLEARIRGYGACLDAIAEAEASLASLQEASSFSLSGVGAEEVGRIAENLTLARRLAEEERFNASLAASTSSSSNARALELKAVRNRDDRVRVLALALFTGLIFVVTALIERPLAPAAEGSGLPPKAPVIAAWGWRPPTPQSGARTEEAAKPPPTPSGSAPQATRG